MVIKYVIPGKARGKGRPRFGGGHAYTDGKTRAYEQMSALLYRSASGGYRFPDGVPLRVEIEIQAAYPARMTRAQRDAAASGACRPTAKPDVDNVIKCVLDSLNGIAYADDAQVAEISACRRYADEACVIVTVREIDH